MEIWQPGTSSSLSLSIHAKVCDFGLAQQVADYPCVRSPHGTASWKWATLELLAELKVSLMSYVTLWEVFSLGIEPYVDVEEFNLNFVVRLQSVMRLGRPEHATEAA